MDRIQLCARLKKRNGIQLRVLSRPILFPPVKYVNTELKTI